MHTVGRDRDLGILVAIRGRIRATRAAVIGRSGLYVSIITAISSVRVVPIDFSYEPGCGTCGIPAGWC